MSISDEEAAAAWKKAQGQVRSRSDLAHLRPVLIWFPICFAMSLFFAIYFAHMPLGEALLISPFIAILATMRGLLRWYRRR